MIIKTVKDCPVNFIVSCDIYISVNMNVGIY